MTEPLKGIIEAMPEDAYHAHPALSSTNARLLLESPAKYKYRQAHPQQGKRAFDLGSAAHSKVLGVGAGVVEYPAEHLTPSGNVSTKAATLLWAEEQRAAGLIPVSPGDIHQVDAMAEAILAHPTARVLLERPGTAEASVFSTDPVTGVDMRARFDFLPDVTEGRRVTVDLKTSSKSAAATVFERTVLNFGYHVQQGHYLDALALSEGDTDPAMVFVVVETEAPHLVAVHQLDVVYSEMGSMLARRARELFRECSDTGKWPGHPDEVTLVSPPTFAVIQHEEKYG